MMMNNRTGPMTSNSAMNAGASDIASCNHSTPNLMNPARMNMGMNGMNMNMNGMNTNRMGMNGMGMNAMNMNMGMNMGTGMNSQYPYHRQHHHQHHQHHQHQHHHPNRPDVAAALMSEEQRRRQHQQPHFLEANQQHRVSPYSVSRQHMNIPMDSNHNKSNENNSNNVNNNNSISNNSSSNETNQEKKSFNNTSQQPPSPPPPPSQGPNHNDNDASSCPNPNTYNNTNTNSHSNANKMTEKEETMNQHSRQMNRNDFMMHQQQQKLSSQSHAHVHGHAHHQHLQIPTDVQRHFSSQKLPAAYASEVQDEYTRQQQRNNFRFMGANNKNNSNVNDNPNGDPAGGIKGSGNNGGASDGMNMNMNAMNDSTPDRRHHHHQHHRNMNNMNMNMMSMNSLHNNNRGLPPPPPFTNPAAASRGMLNRSTMYGHGAGHGAGQAGSGHNSNYPNLPRFHPMMNMANMNMASMHSHNHNPTMSRQAFQHQAHFQPHHHQHHSHSKMTMDAPFHGHNNNSNNNFDESHFNQVNSSTNHQERSDGRSNNSSNNISNKSVANPNKFSSTTDTTAGTTSAASNHDKHIRSFHEGAVQGEASFPKDIKDFQQQKQQNQYHLHCQQQQNQHANTNSSNDERQVAVPTPDYSKNGSHSTEPTHNYSGNKRELAVPSCPDQPSGDSNERSNENDCKENQCGSSSNSIERSAIIKPAEHSTTDMNYQFSDSTRREIDAASILCSLWHVIPSFDEQDKVGSSSVSVSSSGSITAENSIHQQGGKTRTETGTSFRPAAISDETRLISNDKSQSNDDNAARTITGVDSNQNSALFTHPSRLATPDDAKELNSLHCFIREELLELFVINDGQGSSSSIVPTVSNDDEESNDDNRCTTTPSSVSSSPTSSNTASNVQLRKISHGGRVGLRCVHCSQSRQERRGVKSKLHNSNASMSMFYPRKLSDLYKMVCTWQRVHYAKCTHVPPGVRRKYNEIKKNDKTRGKTAFWITSAKKIGLVDDDKYGGGVRFINN